MPRVAVLLLVSLAALTAAPAGALAALVARGSVSDSSSGTARAPRPIGLTAELRVSDADVIVPSALSLSLGAGLRLGGARYSASCTRSLVAAQPSRCGAGSQAGDLRLVVRGPAGDEQMTLALFNAPGGRSLLAVTAAGGNGRPVAQARPLAQAYTQYGARLQFPLTPLLSAPLPRLVSARLQLFAPSRRNQGWLRSTSCPRGAWTIALGAVDAAGTSRAASFSVPCRRGGDFIPAGGDRRRGSQAPGSAGCEPAGPGFRTPGGAGKVSHKGWPAINGMLWQSARNGSHRVTGGCHNDELLGAHGSDVIHGGEGKDVIWGDEIPCCQPSSQHDRLFGGGGGDWIYTSHGTNEVHAGRGNDHVYGYYGHGFIDCGAGYDVVRIRLGGPYRLRNCEKIGHFCAFGPDGHGGCLKPGERRSTARRTRRAP